MSDEQNKPAVIITGVSGDIGSQLRQALSDQYSVFGLDKVIDDDDEKLVECDITSPESIRSALEKIGQQTEKIAAVVHLAAYFNFNGKESPLYEQVNVNGTRNLLDALQNYSVERFIYTSTMLVQAPGVPGEKINENGELSPGWAYPKSKAETEQVIQENHGKIPYVILRLAGLYSDKTAVPTLAHQIARIYERDLKSHLYSGDLMAGQAFIHIEDMLSVITSAIERRHKLPDSFVVLAGENEVMGYQELQNRIGQLVHGDREWSTIEVPVAIAKPGAWLQEKAEPVIPDLIDQGEKPFIRAFMIDLASDHFDLDISRAREWLDWEPQHDIWHGLEKLVDNLKRDPKTWYQNNGIILPQKFKGSYTTNQEIETVRSDHEQSYRHQHQANLWGHFINLALACWLISAPFTLAYESKAMVWSDVICGFLLLILAFASLSWRLRIARWGCGVIGLWLLSAPLLFWAPTAAAYSNGTLVGMLVIGFALLTRPMPGISAIAAEKGPTVPPGWDYSPSDWFQRLPIIILAVVGFLISRYLCAYQLGHIDAVWEPFFAGSIQDPQNGTEEIITSSVSEAWPVPDAGLGALTYALEIITGIMGSSKRWRTMPWMVMAFGIMIVPLGAVSIFFIVIQPIVIGTWCTLCLIAAAAMLIQIPYSIDELIATSEFLYRRKRQGHSLVRTFVLGDTDEGEAETIDESFEKPPYAVIKEMLGGGITLPWNLLVCIPIGLWLMFTRLTLDQTGGMANADHLIGSLVLTVVVTAFAEAGRAARFLLIPLGGCLLFTPFIYGADILSMVNSLVCAVLLIALALPKGPVYHGYGRWNQCIA